LDAPHHVGSQRAAVYVIAGGENKAQDSGLAAEEIMSCAELPSLSITAPSAALPMAGRA
jgi:hypothetical protein